MWNRDWGGFLDFVLFLEQHQVLAQALIFGAEVCSVARLLVQSPRSILEYYGDKTAVKTLFRREPKFHR